jgi:hypothetical protein
MAGDKARVRVELGDHARFGAVQAGIIGPRCHSLPHRPLQVAPDLCQNSRVQRGSHHQVTLVNKEPALPRAEPRLGHHGQDTCPAIAARQRIFPGMAGPGVPLGVTAGFPCPQWIPSGHHEAWPTQAPGGCPGRTWRHANRTHPRPRRYRHHRCALAGRARVRPRGRAAGLESGQGAGGLGDGDPAGSCGEGTGRAGRGSRLVTQSLRAPGRPGSALPGSRLMIAGGCPRGCAGSRAGE